MDHGRLEQRKLAAIMFTDMVGYSAAVQRNEALALELLEEHRQLLRSIFPKHGGLEVKTMGDGFLAQFTSALSASLCAIEIQKVVADRNASVAPERRFQLRIGVHLGDIVHREGDVFGDGVNIAARVEPLAEPGGICISEDVARQIQNKVEQSIIRRGHLHLKNIQQPVEIFTIVTAPDESMPALLARPADQKSIAVLPFMNMSSDRENEFLSDGITEDLITALSQIDGLRVPARTSSFAFKGKNEDIRRIGEQLGVTTVLEGSVRKAGNKLRITAQLINVANGYHVWSEKYDRQMEDVFAVQDEISRAIVAALKLKLTIEGDAPLVKRHTENAEAYQLYLRGRHFWNQRGLGLKKALHYFELALLEDSQYALAYTGLADSYNLLAFYGYLPPKDAAPRAKAATNRALQIDEHLAETQCSLGWARLVYDWDWPAADAAFRRSLEINPNYLPARYWHATYWAALDRRDEVLRLFQPAIELDPLSAFIHTQMGTLLWQLREYDQALGRLQKALELDPHSMLAHWYLGLSWAAKSAPEQAIPELQIAVNLSGRNPLMLSSLGCAYALSGQRDKASEILSELQASFKDTFPRSYSLAMIHGCLGDRDRMFEALDQAFEEREVSLPWIKNIPYFGRYQEDPRFQELVRKMGLPVP